VLAEQYRTAAECAFTCRGREGETDAIHLNCRSYVSGLLSYLTSFYERTQPLAQLGRQMAKVGTSHHKTARKATPRNLLAAAPLSNNAMPAYPSFAHLP
jgi:hypothetical protein